MIKLHPRYWHGWRRVGREEYRRLYGATSPGAGGVGGQTSGEISGGGELWDPCDGRGARICQPEE